MENYILEESKKLGEGSFGQVFKATERGTGRIVAFKKMKFDLNACGLPGNAMREISNMQELKHKHIVRILNIVYADTGTLYLVMEHLEMDLLKYMALVRANHDNAPLPVPLIQKFTRHLMKGLAYCHSHRILHRDLKPANLLIDAQQRLKIADFGSSRTHNLVGRETFSHKVATLWYRAPELLLGEQTYTGAVDIWSVGCVIAEMARGGVAIFRGKSEITQIHAIFRVLGTPDETTWPGLTKKVQVPNWPTQNIREVVPHIPEVALDLVIQCLFYPPAYRISAQRALLHPWLNKHIPQEFPESLKHHYVPTQ